MLPVPDVTRHSMSTSLTGSFVSSSIATTCSGSGSATFATP
jgi:hypothetical protein